MKKTLWILLALIFLTAAMALGVSAEETGKMSLSAQVDGLVRGHTFSVIVDLNRNPGVYSLRAVLKYDETVLDVTGMHDLELLPSVSDPEVTGEGVVLRWRSEEENQDLFTTGHLARIHFRVKDDAPYGESKISIQLSQRFFDAQNSRGAAVPFETQDLVFNLVCPHLNRKVEETVSPSFSAAGAGVEKCSDCGETWDKVLNPALISQDGKTTALVQPGVFSEEEAKGVRVDFLFGGEEAEVAREIFGDSLIRVFRVTFTKGARSFVPQGETKILLSIDFDLPSEFSLYGITTDGAVKKQVERRGDTVEFSYEDLLFVFVLQEDLRPDWIKNPAVTTQTPTPSSPEQDSEATERSREILYFAIGVSVLLLTGVGAVFALRMRRHRF